MGTKKTRVSLPFLGRKGFRRELSVPQPEAKTFSGSLSRLVKVHLGFSLPDRTRVLGFGPSNRVVSGKNDPYLGFKNLRRLNKRGNLLPYHVQATHGGTYGALSLTSVCIPQVSTPSTWNGRFRGRETSHDRTVERSLALETQSTVGCK